MKARIIMTFECPRKCTYCCNEYHSIINGGVKASLWDILDEKPSEILITGGEPILYPNLIKTISRQAYLNDIPTYLYTAFWNPARTDSELEAIISEVNGIHYTLHAATGSNEIQEFYRFQIMINQEKFKHKSFRLFVHSEVRHPIEIHPWLYKRIESKQWIDEKDCQLPEGEKLFILQD